MEAGGRPCRNGNVRKDLLISSKNSITTILIVLSKLMHIPRLVKCLSTFLLCLVGISAQAYTVSKTSSGNAVSYSTDGSESDTQAAINAAADGDIIRLPARSSTWSTGVTVNRGVTIRGQGVSSTTLTNPGTGYSLFRVNCDQVKTRISGIAFKGQYAIYVGGDYTTAQFRIDNCTFNGGTAQGILLQFGNNAPGLVDHCTFSAGGASEMIHNLGFSGGNDAGWLDDVYPGSASAVYIENCTFTKNPMADKYFWGTAAIQSYYGARTVMRYCHLNYCHIDQHGNKPPLYGARWWEFYNNTFYVPANGNQSDYFALRGGSGVVFNNHVSGGPNIGAGQIQLYSDESANPPLCGPGAGIFVNGGRSNSPVYIWGNDPSMTVASTSSNVIQGRDYLVSSTQPTSMIKRQLTTDNASTRYSYKPYVYPHPLDNGSTSQFSPTH
jgi:hypothetical protein